MSLHREPQLSLESKKIGKLACSISDTHALDKPVIFLNTSDILNGKILHSTYSDPASLPGQAKKSITKGDILFSEIRPANGRWAFIDFDADDYVVSTKLMVIRPTSRELLPKFLYYFLTSNDITNYLQQQAEARSGTFPQITFTEVSLLDIPLLSRDEQEKAVEFIDAIDERIKICHQQNETLEAMARAIFKSWFVDFDPVRAKAEGRTPEGMDAATAALFPSTFTDSPLGPIPEGWHVLSLDQIADFLNGLALQKFPSIGPDYLPVIKIAQLRLGSTDGADKASCEIPPQYVIENGDHIFSWSGSLMHSIWCGGTGALNQHLFKVSSKDYPKWFIYQWLDQHMLGFRAIAASKATTMGHIQRHHLTEAKCIVPPKEVIPEIGGTLNALETKVLNNKKQAHLLADLRDTLLPRLISGKLRLTDAQALTEDAA